MLLKSIYQEEFMAKVFNSFVSFKEFLIEIEIVQCKDLCQPRRSVA